MHLSGVPHYTSRPLHLLWVHILQLLCEKLCVAAIRWSMHHTNRSKFTLPPPPPPPHPISLRDRWRGTERDHRHPFRVASMSHPRKIAVLSQFPLSLSLLSYSLVPSLSFCVGDLVTSRNDIAHSFNCVYREQYSSLIWCNTLDVKGRYTSSSPVLLRECLVS